MEEREECVICEVRRIKESQGSSVVIATGYGLDNQGLGIQFLAGARKFSLLHHVHTGCGAHPASYPMGTRGSFPGG
jgi:hypothetical protein